MIYISSSGFGRLNPLKILKLFKKNNIRYVELSGGVYLKNIYNVISKNKYFKLSLHNYFPVPKKPFVINLASLDKKIASRSINQLKKSICLSQKIKSQFFSFHAGFTFDPSPKELGKKILYKNIYNKKKCFEIFIKRVNYLSNYAKKKNVKLLIENNVITKSNLLHYKKNPLLLCEPNEIISFFKKVPEEVGLLLDLAHLKVSSKTLRFNVAKAHSKLLQLISGYHISDNSGEKDTNSAFSKNSWFWKIIRKDLDYYSIEVYSENISLLKKLKNILFNHINSK
jgi:sugar phosphate isomerase/epimerase